MCALCVEFPQRLLHGLDGLAQFKPQRAISVDGFRTHHIPNTLSQRILTGIKLIKPSFSCISSIHATAVNRECA